MASDHFICSIGDWEVEQVEEELVCSKDFGADLRFYGVVRELEDGKTISAIRYSHYEDMAIKELRNIGDSMAVEYPGHAAFVYHRIGEVRAGEASLLIQVQTKHSAEGFEIMKEYLHRIKSTVPIWKEPVWEESSSK